MYVYQEGKLYIQKGETLVGVEIYSDKVLLVENEQAILDESLGVLFLTKSEIYSKFGIATQPYIFPRSEVAKDEPVVKAKTRARKSSISK